MRLLYVGLTRARAALWVWGGAATQRQDPPLAAAARRAHALAELEALARPPVSQHRARGSRPTPRACHRQSQAIAPARAHAATSRCAATGGSTASASCTGRSRTARMRRAERRPRRTPLAAQRRRGRARAPVRRRASRRPLRQRAAPRAGARRLRRLARWRDDAPPPAPARPLVAGAARPGLRAEPTSTMACAMLTPLVARHAQRAAARRRAPVRPAAGRARRRDRIPLRPRRCRRDALLAVLHAHGVRAATVAASAPAHGCGPDDRQDRPHLRARRARARARLQVQPPAAYDARHAGARRCARSEYDLQALLYTLALHRWLRFRLGDGYDYARDFGGVRYLFCRGLDAGARRARHHAPRFAAALVDALDALLGGGGARMSRIDLRADAGCGSAVRTVDHALARHAAPARSGHARRRVLRRRRAGIAARSAHGHAALDPRAPQLLVDGADRLARAAARGLRRCAHRAGSPRRTPDEAARPRRWCSKTACCTCAAIASTNTASPRGLQRHRRAHAPRRRRPRRAGAAFAAAVPRRTRRRRARRAPPRSRCCARCCWSPAAPAPARPPRSRACCCCSSRRRSARRPRAAAHRAGRADRPRRRRMAESLRRALDALRGAPASTPRCCDALPHEAQHPAPPARHASRTAALPPRRRRIRCRSTWSWSTRRRWSTCR